MTDGWVGERMDTYTTHTPTPHIHTHHTYTHTHHTYTLTKQKRTNTRAHLQNYRIFRRHIFQSPNIQRPPISCQASWRNNKRALKLNEPSYHSQKQWYYLPISSGLSELWSTPDCHWKKNEASQTRTTLVFGASDLRGKYSVFRMFESKEK